MPPEAESSTASAGNRTLDKALVAAGLRNLGRTADGLKNAFLDLIVRGENISRIDLIEQYPHLQHVDLSNNALSSLRPLGALRYLLSVSATDNELAEVLDFESPFILHSADLSRNRIASIRDLSAFVHLRSLVLDGNQIQEIAGLERLVNLEVLSLNNNAVTRISGLAKCPIKELLLNGNRIKRIENIESLQELRVLELRDNQITSLRGLEGHPVLSAVDLENNGVASVDECRFVAGLACLRHLNLAGNAAIQATPAYRSILLFRLPALLSLDRAEVTPEEKVAAANFHGADREARREIRQRYFPDGELSNWPRTDLDDEVPAVVALSLAMTGTAGPEGFHPSPAEDRPLSESGRFSETVRPAPHSYGPPEEIPEDAVPELAGDPAASGGLSLRPAAAQPVFVAGVTSLLDFSVADRFAARAPAQAAGSVQELAAHLASICGEGVDPAVRDAMRARTIYRWICTNVAFDVARLQRGYSASDLHESGAAVVLRRRRAVAAGYAELFVALAAGAGLEAALVAGYGKGPGYRVAARFDRHNHTWNAVRVAGAWRLVDCCWGAGQLSADGADWAPRFLEHYFLTPPHHFVADHLPLEPRWQLPDEFPPELGPRPLTRGDFERRPCLRPAFFEHGLALASHAADAVIPAAVQLPVSIALEAPPGVGLYASLEQVAAGEGRSAPPSAGREGPLAQAVREQLEASLVVRDGGRAEVSVVCPAPGDYVLSLAARSSATAEKPQLAVVYLVQASHGGGGEGAAGRRMASAFPRQTAAFGASEASLLSPLEGALPSGTVQFFSLRLPAAEAVAVVDAAGEWHNMNPAGSISSAPAVPAPHAPDRPSHLSSGLASAGGAGQGAAPVAFEGRIKVQGTGTLSVQAKLAGQRTYTPLLYYQVFPKAAVQLAAAGAAPPTFSVTNSK
eukprot:tig00001234_g7741.t1